MKNLFSALILLTTLTTLAGCTKAIYSHQEVMARYQNKTQVVAGFGFPTEKKSLTAGDEWLYNPGIIITAASSGIITKDSTSSKQVTQFSNYRRYTIFTFDNKGNVLKYETRGISNSVRVSNTLGTVLLGIAGIGAIILIIIAADHGGSSVNV